MGTPSTPTIMIVRHGEKPVDTTGKPADAYLGIDLKGQSDSGSDSLIPQGWMRCGALGRFFVPQRGVASPAGILVPTHLYAAASTLPCPATFSLPSNAQQPPPIVTASASTQSLREQELLLAVSALSQLPINATYEPGNDENKLSAKVAALSSTSVALIAWEHHNIPTLAQAVDKALGAHVGSKIPQKWDKTRFDLVWVFSPSQSGYKFLQIPQMLLPGDSPEPLPC